MSEVTAGTLRSHAVRLFAALLAVPACAGAPSVVTRTADGVIYDARYIPPEAYAAYARGAWLEARGDLSGALAAFETALDFDPESPEIRAKLASIRCRLATSAAAPEARRAEAELERALTLDPESSPALVARARCRARFGDTRAALDSALRAARVDPESITVQLLVVDLAEAAGDLALARTWLDALVTRTPDSRLAWERLAAFARKHDDSARALRAAQALRALRADELTRLATRSSGATASSAQGASSGMTAEAALTQALAEGDLPRARRAAARLGITPGELAARAAASGATDLAKAQAELVLDADPSDPDAWITLLWLESSAESLETWVTRLRAAPRDSAHPPSPTARRLHAELLERLAGSDARRAWEAAF